MNKLRMTSQDLVKNNIEKIENLFPNCITEKIEDSGKIVKAINFDILRQELSDEVVEGNEERYVLTWPDKKKSILLSNSPVAKTLRPCREESVNFNSTKNLYIEGDNLDVLKILRETYLGKIKVISIDPPYNTGNDFVYEDDFSETIEDHLFRSTQIDDLGNKLVENPESNGRYHTDWLNMMYPRLKVSKDLLSEDGIIFIHIDDNECYNLIKMCNEIFGEDNYIGNLVWKSRQNKDNRNISGLSIDHEYIVIYGKNNKLRLLKGSDRKTEQYSNPDNDVRGDWTSGNMVGILDESLRPNCHYDLINPSTNINYGKPRMGWRYDKNTMDRLIKENRILWPDNPEGRPRRKVFLNELSDNLPGLSSLFGQDIYTRNGTAEIESLFGFRCFDYPKPTQLIDEIIMQSTNYDKPHIILDFFSGSATTAHSVLNVNSIDSGSRQFILVQIPEATNPNSPAYNFGLKNICEIGKERIRRAGNKIIENNPLTTNTLDIGFRVFKLDSSNMNDVFYFPDHLSKDLLDSTTDNIKPDRTGEDLLFQLMLEFNLTLDMPIEKKDIQGKEVFIVNENDLIACFDKCIEDTFIKELAILKPLYAVFRDLSFFSDSVKINIHEIFKMYSPTTEVKVL